MNRKAVDFCPGDSAGEVGEKQFKWYRVERLEPEIPAACSHLVEAETVLFSCRIKCGLAAFTVDGQLLNPRARDLLVRTRRRVNNFSVSDRRPGENWPTAANKYGRNWRTA